MHHHFAWAYTAGRLVREKVRSETLYASITCKYVIVCGSSDSLLYSWLRRCYVLCLGLAATHSNLCLERERPVCFLRQ